MRAVVAAREMAVGEGAGNSVRLKASSRLDHEDDDDIMADDSSLDEDNEDSEDEESVRETASAQPARRLIPTCESLWPKRMAPTVYFAYPRDAELVRTGEPPKMTALGTRRLYYRCAWERNCVKRAFAGAGFHRVKDGCEVSNVAKRKEDKSMMSEIVDAVGELLQFTTAIASEEDLSAGKKNSKKKRATVWCASWTKHPPIETYGGLNRFQKVNHFPGSWCIGRKDRLLRTICRARKFNKEAYAYVPESYSLPGESRSLELRSRLEPETIWIVKPPASSCGRGIRLVQSKDLTNTLPADKKLVAQRYVARPFLIKSRKFDLRVYALLTSVDPVIVFVHEDGLVRFSTHPYTTRNLRCRYVHLTNYSVNKKSKRYVEANDVDDASKWSLSRLWNYLSDRGFDASNVRDEICELIVKTIVAAEADLTPSLHRALRGGGKTKRHPPPKRPCFELFGFDILLDSRLKPWLIEVNVSPSLMGGSKLDRAIKGRLMADVFHVVGFEPLDAALLKAERRANKFQQRRGVTIAHSQDRWKKSRRLEDIDLAKLTEEEWELLMRAEDESVRAASSGFVRCWPPEPAGRPAKSNLSLARTRAVVDAILPLFQTTRFSDCLLARAALTPPRLLYKLSPFGLPRFLLDGPASPRSHSQDSQPRKMPRHHSRMLDLPPGKPLRSETVKLAAAAERPLSVSGATARQSFRSDSGISCWHQLAYLNLFGSRNASRTSANKTRPDTQRFTTKEVPSASPVGRLTQHYKQRRCGRPVVAGDLMARDHASSALHATEAHWD